MGGLALSGPTRQRGPQTGSISCRIRNRPTKRTSFVIVEFVPRWQSVRRTRKRKKGRDMIAAQQSRFIAGMALNAATAKGFSSASWSYRKATWGRDTGSLLRPTGEAQGFYCFSLVGRSVRFDDGADGLHHG